MIQICGLTVAEAAAVLEVKPRRAQRWADAVWKPSDEALTRMSALWQDQKKQVERFVKDWQAAGRPPEVILTIGDSAEAAQAMGWPSVGAQRAVAALVQAEIAPSRVHLVEADSKAVKEGLEALA